MTGFYSTRITDNKVRAHTDPSSYIRRPGRKARGAQLCRKPTLTAHQKRKAPERAASEFRRDIARSYNVSRSTISSLS